MSELYSRFLAYVPPVGLILDAGCGSGRDSRFFLENGYRVVAFDASREMAQKSSALIGQEVLCFTFDEFESDQLFDAVWACASLLHVEKDTLLASIENLTGYLKKQGIFYMSFKYGVQDYEKDVRVFSCFSEKSFSSFIAPMNNLAIVEIFRTADVRKDRADEYWLNCILRRV